MGMRRRLCSVIRKVTVSSCFLALSVLLFGCSDTAPPCPLTGTDYGAPSAGCFSMANGELLVVQGLNGKIGLPGGLRKSGESAQCAAFRETWEETGLQLYPAELLQVFSKDFHLYRCDHMKQTHSEPPLSLEIWAWFYLAPEEFGAYEWRFDEERDVVRALVSGRGSGS